MKISTCMSYRVLLSRSKVTGQREIQDGTKQNGGSPCYLKMKSFVEIVQVANCQEVPDVPRKY